MDPSAIEGSNKVKEVFLRCWRLINRESRRKLVFTSIITVLLNFLDLVAVGLIGVVGALAIRGIQSQGIGERTGQVLDILGLEEQSFQAQILFLGALAFFLLVIRSFLVYYFTKRIYLFLGNEASKLSRLLVERVIHNPVNRVNSLSSQEYVFHINGGATHIMLGIVGTTFALFSDIALFIFLVTLLMVADFESALASGILFVSAGFILFLLMQNKAKSLGEKTKILTVALNEKVLELTGSLREILTRNTQEWYVSQIFDGRSKLVGVSAQQKMMPVFSKYTIESVAFFTFLAIAALQFVLNDTSRAIGNLALFLAASSRISPAILRIQQGLIQIKSAMGSGGSTLEIVYSTDFSQSGPDIGLGTLSPSLVPEVKFHEVSFDYDGLSSNFVESLDFEIPPYSFVGLVGPSGAGKSTIVDLLFGLFQPKEGDVLIGGIPARQALARWPGCFGYVPQNVLIHKGTVISNLLLGIERTPALDRAAIEALKLVGMYEHITNMEGGIEALVSDKGGNFSGGQRQRLGIARALVTNPRILVLDESTSALDAMSEKFITDSILKLKKDMTIIVVAHRLSTVKAADNLIYIDEGKVIAMGKFENLRRKILEFDAQAKLMGL